MRLPLPGVVAQTAREVALLRELAGRRRAASHRMWLARTRSKSSANPTLDPEHLPLASATLFVAAVAAALTKARPTSHGQRELANGLTFQ